MPTQHSIILKALSLLKAIQPGADDMDYMELEQLISDHKLNPEEVAALDLLIASPVNPDQGGKVWANLDEPE